MARTKQPIKAKEPIRIRFKKLANGNQSIYLDCYKDGKRVYEFLKLYLIPENTPLDKQHNREMLTVANAIKSQRVIDLANGEAGIKSNQKAKMLLVDFIEHYKNELVRRGSKMGSAVERFGKRIIEFGGGNVRLCDVDKDFCVEFLGWLRNDYKTSKQRPLVLKSVHNDFVIFRACLNTAKRAGLIQENPFCLFEQNEKVKVPESTRVYLTASEVKKLIETDYKRPIIKQVFLFSCYCGLRVSDIINLKWGNIITDGNQKRIEIVVQKTKRSLTVPLSKNALNYLPERGTATESQNVFNLPHVSVITKYLKQWATQAGITKNVSMHTARHTFATLLLTKDVNLKLIQDLLGHANIQTTQVYAKIIDSKKVEAVNVLNEL